MLGLLLMSIHLYTLLSEQEVRDAIGSTAGLEVSGDRGLISVGQSGINFTIEPTVPDCPCGMGRAFKDGRCKVNFFGYKPFEREIPLQETMRVDAEVKRIIESVIRALRPIRINED
jgi:hypothetical protein